MSDDFRGAGGQFKSTSGQCVDGDCSDAVQPKRRLYYTVLL